MKSKSGITRAEVVTMTVILIVLLGLLMPWVYNSRVKSQRTFCESRQMVVAKGLFLRSVDTPSFPGYREIQATLGTQEPVATSWVFPLLPYIHPLGSEIAEEIKHRQASDLSMSDNIDLFRTGPYAERYKDFGNQGDSPGSKITDYVVELVCPELKKSADESSEQPLSFVVNCGMPDQRTSQGPADHLANGVFFDRLGGADLMKLDFLLEHDGLETTLMLSENLDAGSLFDTQEHQVGFVWIDSFVDQVAQRDDSRLLGINAKIEGKTSLRSARPSSDHPGGVNVAFCDGSTMFLNEQIDYLVFVHYMTTASQEVRVAGSTRFAKEPYRLSGGSLTVLPVENGSRKKRP